MRISRKSSTSQVTLKCAAACYSISKHGLSAEEIRNVSSSKTAIDNFIEGHLQKENPEYARMKQAGITAKLSDQLQDLKDALLRLEAINPGRGGNKFENLIFINTWKADSETLENLSSVIDLKFMLKVKGFLIIEKSKRFALTL